MFKDNKLTKLFWVSLCAYAAAWSAHLAVGTATLRGLFGDASLAFFIYLSKTSLFNASGNIVHLFSVAAPRDFHLLLSGIGLQMALLVGVCDPEVLKHFFVFWQFAVPGLLYILLFYFLWRAKKTSWAIFPLISWAILSVPIEWASINSTRFAMPLLWMHFFLVLFADRKIKTLPLASALLLGFAMWDGLYENVVLHGLLCLLLGLLLWRRDKNTTPLLFAAMVLPGMIRTALSYIDIGHTAPNGFHEMLLTLIFVDPYFLFIALALCFVFALWFASKIESSHFFVFLGLFFMAGGIVIEAPKPSVWWQSEIRFDYVILSLALMVWAGTMHIARLTPQAFARHAAIITFLTGTVLWLIQGQQSYDWRACYQQYRSDRGDKTLIIGDRVASLYATGDNTKIINQAEHAECLWDWSMPWMDLLLQGNQPTIQWPIMTFWQDFSFIEKDGLPYLHTNNWTLTSPSLQTSGADLPLKTKLYDLTPLYQSLGYGAFIERTNCLKAEDSGDYWRAHLMSLDNNKRREMFVCPKAE